MAWEKFKDVSIGSLQNPNLKEKFSITADILTFETCPRQYGFFKVRKYQPSHIVQIWYGKILHQVLDKLHMHYKGLLDPSLKGTIPTEQEVEKYFEQVRNSLKARGIKAITDNVRDAALKVLKRFNKLEGNKLYPHVQNTECKLQTDKQEYVLHGVVDVLKNTSVVQTHDNFAPLEIWDYKGTKYPDTQTKVEKKKFANYKF